MNYRKIVYNNLESNIEFRERRNKDIGLAKILIDIYPDLKVMRMEDLTQMVKDYSNIDRAWRKLLEERPELRGKDYHDKDNLEREKMAEIGYNTPKIAQDVEAGEPLRQEKLI